MARKVTRGSPPRLARARARTWTPARAPAPKAEPAAAPASEQSEKTTSGSDDDGESTLGVYFREMSGLGVMSPDQELTSATRIAELRVEHWRRILSYPPVSYTHLTLPTKRIV